MKINSYHSNHSDRIIVMGMSCVGKTTFAKLLPNRYICFDALFPWHQIEGFNLSISEALAHVNWFCTNDFTLDGWHLSDPTGLYFPWDCMVYVVYAPYEKIIGQYRVEVTDPNQHRPMFDKWYRGVDYPRLRCPVRYFENTGDFEERSVTDFYTFLRT
jgi:hypothetical protein